MPGQGRHSGLYAAVAASYSRLDTPGNPPNTRGMNLNWVINRRLKAVAVLGTPLIA